MQIVRRPTHCWLCLCVDCSVLIFTDTLMRSAQAQLIQTFGRRELEIGGSLARRCKAPAFTRGCYCPNFWRWPITQAPKAASGCVWQARPCWILAEVCWQKWMALEGRSLFEMDSEAVTLNCHDETRGMFAHDTSWKHNCRTVNRIARIHRYSELSLSFESDLPVSVFASVQRVLVRFRICCVHKLSWRVKIQLVPGIRVLT